MPTVVRWGGETGCRQVGDAGCHQVGVLFGTPVATGGVAGDGLEFDAANRGMVLNRAIVNASRVDSEVGRWLLDLAAGLVHPSELFGRRGLVDRILELGDHGSHAAAVGPSRHELLDLLGGR